MVNFVQIDFIKISATVTCASHMFTCNNGKCVEKYFICDNANDCGDHSDEMNCFLPMNSGKCQANQFACTTNQSICLDHEAKCNGTTECPGGDDERNCSLCGKFFFL